MIIPPTRFRDNLKGRNGKNHLVLGITMRRGLKYGSAIYAQEVAEWNSRFQVAVPVATAAALMASAIAYLAVSSTTIIMLAGWIAWWVALNIADRIVVMRRGFEYWGRAVEWRAAVRMGADEDGYLISEARNLLTYDVHSDDDLDRIIDGIFDNKAAADRWLDKHWVKIQRAYAKGAA